ncbi:hypothetical protein [Ruminiclostridium cellobioparum]|uniref:hypothetical protein n=1 Tax=Ruminiclostridium cellobioparum TaxID=29355 RepID=UPI000481F0E6|nr:hypothetical protein [Ruminiclostridium cellobioparum]
MHRSSFNMISLGFLFLLIDFRIQNFDILPDIVGYILFAVGFHALASYSEYFKKASYVNIPLLVGSILDIYKPASTPSQAGGVSFDFGVLGFLAIPVILVVLVLNMLVVYFMFQGIIEMALEKGLGSLADEAGRRWKEYLYLQVAILFSFIVAFLPVIGIAFIIALGVISLVITFAIMRFMKVCGENL